MKWKNEVLHSASTWYQLGLSEFAVKSSIDRWGAENKGIDGLIAMRCMDCGQNNLDINLSAETVKAGFRQAQELRDFAHYLIQFANEWQDAAATIVEPADEEMS